MKGQRFGRLTVVERRPSTGTSGSRWLCQCDCGGSTVARASALRGGTSRSCGCLQREAVTKHGGRRTNLYRTWSSMKRRCGSPSATSYANYGGRGISVCERWQNSFENFRADMGPKPSSSHTLDRINNDGNYEPGNCRWATTAEQSLNKRPDRRTTPASVVHKIVALRGHFTGVDIAKALNVSRSTVKKAWKRAAK